MKRFDSIYRKIKEEPIRECGGTGVIYEHINTGARIFTLKNADDNKVFMIGFRTTPSDDTGVPHILEHSVLCGSDKFPLKDPFVELAKGSLNTFLNAMTYPDKTVYPVASVNDKDFMNLMDVYLDAVFHPNIYKEPKIFMQEGWHYEMQDPADELKINGVVYNEMKGVFSNPDSVLERYTLNTLFSGNTYGVESGGDPDFIPELSYKDFTAFHAAYYHPSNSYIYLYGDMDMEEKLLWIEDNYLSAYEKREIDSSIGRIEPFDAPRDVVKQYAISDAEEESGHTYLSKNYVISNPISQVTNLSWQVLEFLLLDSPGAVLREALIDAGIGEDITGGYTSGILQPYFSVTAKNAECSDRERFESVIGSTLKELVEKGIDKKSLCAAINYFEFKYREADFGRTPAGLMYGLTALDSWLYDEDPFVFICYEDAFAEIKKLSETDWFEQLINKDILGNSFSASVTICPEKGLTARKDAELKAKLAAYRDSLSEAEIAAIVENTAALKAYQGSEDTEEALSSLPVLKISDIDREPKKLHTTAEDGIIHTDIDTHGIAYVKVMFNTAKLDEHELQLVSFIRSMLGELDTVHYSYRDLTDETLLNTGGIDFGMSSFTDRDDKNFRGYLTSDLCVLEGKIGTGLKLVAEILKNTLYDDIERISDKVFENKSRVRTGIDAASHSAAVMRAGSYIRPELRYDEINKGIAYYDFISSLIKLSEDKKAFGAFAASLKPVMEKLLDADAMLIQLTGSAAALSELKAELPEFKAAFGHNSENAAYALNSFIKPAGILNEGIKTSSQVSYTARYGDFGRHGLKYSGALQVLKVMMNYDYLWINLRVKGGAYGCMSGFGRSGMAYMVSYRDPHIAETDEIYGQAAEYVRNAELSDMALTKYIIGAIAGLDHPSTASVTGQKELNCFMSGVSYEELCSERREILDCSSQDINALAGHLDALMDTGVICTIGNAEQVMDCSALFKNIKELN